MHTNPSGQTGAQLKEEGQASSWQFVEASAERQHLDRDGGRVPRLSAVLTRVARITREAGNAQLADYEMPVRPKLGQAAFSETWHEIVSNNHTFSS
jgi:hypothetical protein